jgi:XRE family aerobic/anaerobic benzoate catabolism transcriptional regulator
MDVSPDSPNPRPDRDPLLVAVGERIRLLRLRRGLTRKALAAAADISERHLANLELGTGNASILVLAQVARALECALAEVIGDSTTASPEGLLIRSLLAGRSEPELQQVRQMLSTMFGQGRDLARAGRIALVGLRGAGKSTLGQILSESLGLPFIELSREIERIAGCGLVEIHSLVGSGGYRRYEREALEAAIETHPRFVMATPGGLVSEPGTFGRLIDRCFTVWLRATPEDHMGRVMAQGDFRPMAASREAMEDLRRILAGREAFYAKADLTFDTSGRTLELAGAELLSAVGVATGIRPDKAVPAA